MRATGGRAASPTAGTTISTPARRKSTFGFRAWSRSSVRWKRSARRSRALLKPTPTRADSARSPDEGGSKGPATSAGVRTTRRSTGPPWAPTNASIIAASGASPRRPLASRQAATARRVLSPARPSITPGEKAERSSRICRRTRPGSGRTGPSGAAVGRLQAPASGTARSSVPASSARAATAGGGAVGGPGSADSGSGAPQAESERTRAETAQAGRNRGDLTRRTGTSFPAGGKDAVNPPLVRRPGLRGTGDARLTLASGSLGFRQP